MLNWQNYLVLAVILAVSSPTSGQTQTSGQSGSELQWIELNVTPAKLVLGETSDVVVRAKAKSADGQSLSCDDIRIHASQGSITDLDQTGDGEYTAQYVLPDDFFPRFALIAASANCSDKTVTGSIVVELFGTGRVEVKAKPYSDVVLEIADDKFGPFKTNDRGKVKIPIVVAPGVQTGVVGDKTIDLNLPPVNRIVAIPENKGIPTVPGAETIIVIYAIDDVSGKPLLNAQLNVQPDKGRISKIIPAAPGVYRAHYTPPTHVGDGQDTVSVSLRGDTVSETQLTMQLVSGEPTRIDLKVQPETYKAGSDTPIEISIRLTDENGNPTNGEINASADVGKLEYPQAVAPGEYRTKLSIPNHFDGKKKATITIQVSSNKDVKVDKIIELEPSTPATIDLEAPTIPIPTDGLSTTDIPFQLLDSYKNPVTDVDIETSVSQGTTPENVTIKDGNQVIPFTPPLKRGSKPKSATIKAAAGDVRGETTVPLTWRTYVLALNPSVGLVSNFKHSHAPYFSIPIDISLWLGLHLILDPGYYFSKGTEKSDELTYEATFHSLPLMGGLGYRIRISPKIYFALSASVGMLLVYNWEEYKGASYSKLTHTSLFGAKGLLSIGILAGPGHIVLQAGYQYSVLPSPPSSETDQTDSTTSDEITTLAGNMGGLVIRLGYRFKLF